MLQALLSLLLLNTIAFSVTQDQTSFRDAKPVLAGDDRGKAELKLGSNKLQRGELFAVEYTFYNTNSNHSVYNPFFNRLKPLPGQLAIYDASKRYLGDLIKYEGGSQALIGDSDWVFLSEGSHIGSRIGFRAGYVPMTKHGSMGELLPVGKYYIQLILYKVFLSANPGRVEGNQPDFYKTFDKSELCRSNLIEISLVDN